MYFMYRDCGGRKNRAFFKALLPQRNPKHKFRKFITKNVIM